MYMSCLLNKTKIDWSCRRDYDHVKYTDVFTYCTY